MELRLTEAGAAALAECDARTRAWLCDRLSGLSDAELDRLAGSLRGWARCSPTIVRDVDHTLDGTLLTVTIRT